MKSLLIVLLSFIGILIAYLLIWPVPVAPSTWQAPPNPGYTGVFAGNTRLQSIETLAIGDHHGPEEVILDHQGRLYVTTQEGWIVRLNPDGSQSEDWIHTGGRPLGIAFDNAGNLIVADAFRGLLQITPAGRLKVLTSQADGIPIRYANNVDVAADGKIYFSDASTKFAAETFGGTYAASLLDILEHGGHGRLLVYDPVSQRTITLLKDLNFANGVAVSHDQRYVLITETGTYRILRYWLTGVKTGQTETVIEALPGFPDNLTTGQNGRYWTALIAPRNPLLDYLADKPWLRKLVQRLPAFLRPAAASYGHIIAFNSEGQVLLDLQDPTGAYPLITSVTETDDSLYLGSLSTPAIGRLAKTKLAP